MRDYDELIERLRYCADRPICFSTQCDYRQTAHIGACFDSLKHDAADAIEELLAKVPKQGEWLPHPNPQFIEVDVCSVCGLGTRKMYHCTDGIQTWDEKPFFRYCPWCGAKLSEPPKGVE